MASTSNLSALRILILSPSLSNPQIQTQTQPSQDADNDETTAAPSPSPFPPLLKALTSTTPAPSITTFAGYTSHPPLHLKTRYYERDVGIWCDELPPVSFPRKQSTSASRPSTAGSAGSAAAGPPATPTSPRYLRGSGTEGMMAFPERIRPTITTATSPTRLPQFSHNIDIDATPQSPLKSEPAEPTEPDPPTLKTWKSELLSSLAREVLASIGAIVLILPIPSSPAYPSTPAEKVSLMEYMSAVNEVKDAIEDMGRDVGTIFVLQPEVPGKEANVIGRQLGPLADKFEDKCQEMGVFGWDFVCWDGTNERKEMIDPENDVPEGEDDPLKRNFFGERVGIARVKEVLEGVDWSITPSLTDDPTNEDEHDNPDEFNVFGGDRYKGLDAELQQEMMGLKLSMMDAQGSQHTEGAQQEGEDMSIDQMSALMERVVAIRETGSEMDKGDRENYAKREVEKIMRELG